MNDTEFNEFMNFLVTEFEQLGQKLSRGGLIAQEWKKAMATIDKALANRTLRRWVWKFNGEPTLDRFMQLAEEMSSELQRNQRRTQREDDEDDASLIERNLTQAALKAGSPDDMLWASLHVDMVIKMTRMKVSRHDNFRINRYRQIEEEYPQFKADCETALLDLGAIDDVPF